MKENRILVEKRLKNKTITSECALGQRKYHHVVLKAHGWSPHEIDTICFLANLQTIKSHTLWVDLMTTMGIEGLSDTVTTLHHDNKTTLPIWLLSYFTHD